MMKKLANAGYGLVLLLTALFPLASALHYGVPYFQGLAHQSLMIFIALMCLACLALFLSLVSHNGFAGKRKALIPALIFLMSMGMKVFFAYGIGCDAYQHAEYGCVVSIASGGGEAYLTHISIFPHWSLVCYFDKIFVSMFSSTPAYLVCEYVNAVLLSLTAVILFFIGLEIFDGSVLKATMGSVLFAFAPTENLYFLMASNEFLAIFFLSAAVLLALKSGLLLECGNDKRNALFVAAMGISLFIVKFTKPVGIVLPVAIAICWLYLYLSGKDTYSVKVFRKAMIGLVCVYVIQVILSAGYMGWLSAKTHVPINHNAAPHFLFKGLDPLPDPSLWNSYEPKVIESGMDYKAVNAEFMNMIRKDLKGHITDGYLWEKLKWNCETQWGDYGAGVRMVTLKYYETGTGQSFFNMVIAEPWLKTLTQAHYLCVLLFALLSVAVRIRFRSRNDVRYLLIALLVLGVSLGMIIGESQERYKCVIMPYVYMFAGDGITLLWRQLEKAVSKILA